MQGISRPETELVSNDKRRPAPTRPISMNLIPVSNPSEQQLVEYGRAFHELLTAREVKLFAPGEGLSCGGTNDRSKEDLHTSIVHTLLAKKLLFKV